MPFVEYILLALLGSGGVALSDSDPITSSNLTLGAEAIVQPNGGDLLVGQRSRKGSTSRSCDAGSKDALFTPQVDVASPKLNKRNRLAQTNVKTSKKGRHYRQTATGHSTGKRD